MEMKKPKGIRQFIKYALIGIIASAVELGVFALLSLAVFPSLKDVDFRWWILDYSVERGGLGTFYAVVISFVFGQTVNFFVQRKATFKSNNNPVLSAVMYAVMVIAVWVFQMFIVGILTQWLSVPFGPTWGGISAKAASMTLSLAITFPLNKYVIMRRRDRAEK